MLSQIDTLKILDCSKSSLSKYVKNGDLKRIKKGRNTFYDEHEVVELVASIKADREQFRPDLSKRKKETIVLPPLDTDTSLNFKNTSISSELTEIGIFYLQNIIDHLKELNLYKEFYLPTLNRYARVAQLYDEYSLLADNINNISTNNSGSESVHPYHKVAQDYKKEMNKIEDNFGLNPLALKKLTIIKKEEDKPINSILDIETNFEDKNKGMKI